jgi:Ca2+-binding RTX toxin-like protein
MGSGSDTFIWDPGDASDVVEGEGDSDTLRFNGSAGAEIFAASANGGRMSFTRNLGNIVMDTNDVETLDLRSLGGADTVTLNDLTGTEVSSMFADLGVNNAGDASADVVNVNGTGAVDVIQAAAVGTTPQVNGLFTQLTISNSEAANDRLTVNGLGGNDTVSGSTGLAALIQLTLDGGDSNDTINGGNGADTLLGGAGNDTIDGNQGNDTALMGAGNDTFVWDPGDGSDTIEGQGDFDTLTFNGSAGAEIFTASSNGGRMLFTRNVGNIVMDVDDVERLALNTLGATDTVTVNDLLATDVTDVDVDLGVNGASDAAIDAVTVNGTVAVDVVSISGGAGAVTLATPGVEITLANAAPANDTLTVNTSGGDDMVSASGLANTSVVLTLNGGNDNDILVGSAGNDTINGEDGNDLMFGRAGNDTFTGGAGTDEANGEAGADIDGGGNETFNQ